MSITPIPEGHIGAVVTYLEMTGRPFLPEPSSPSLLGEGDHAQHGGGATGGGPPGEAGGWRGSPLHLELWPAPDPARYRDLFRKVGAPWLWYSRLVMDDERLRQEMAEVYAILDPAGAEVGLLELDFRTQGECLIRFLGLVPELAGKGHGAWLFARTLALAWRPDVRRVHVNTCTLDHPAALPAYLKAGFTACKRAFESFPDPRLAGLLPLDCAPQLPLVEAAAAGSDGASRR